MAVEPLFDVASFGPSNTKDTELTDAFVIQQSPENCQEAQNRLAMGAMGEAVLYVHRVCRGNIQPREIISLCYETLMYAARQVDASKNRFKVYDPKKGRFFAYAKPYLRSAVHSWWGQQDVVKGSNTRMETLYQEVAPTTLLEIIFDEEHPAPDHITPGSEVAQPEFERITLAELAEDVRLAAAETLSAPEMDFLRLYYEASLPLSQVGDKLGGISREGARLRHLKIMAKLRKALEKRGFKIGVEKYLD